MATKSTIHEQFKQDMWDAGLEVFDYKGRDSYHGPAVTVPVIEDAMDQTAVSCQWDRMGLEFVVYPK